MSSKSSNNSEYLRGDDNNSQRRSTATSTNSRNFAALYGDEPLVNNTTSRTISTRFRVVSGNHRSGGGDRIGSSRSIGNPQQQQQFYNTNHGGSGSQHPLFGPNGNNNNSTNYQSTNNLQIPSNRRLHQQQQLNVRGGGGGQYHTGPLTTNSRGNFTEGSTASMGTLGTQPQQPRSHDDVNSTNKSNVGGSAVVSAAGGQPLLRAGGAGNFAIAPTSNNYIGNGEEEDVYYDENGVASAQQSAGSVSPGGAATSHLTPNTYNGSNNNNAPSSNYLSANTHEHFTNTNSCDHLSSEQFYDENGNLLPPSANPSSRNLGARSGGGGNNNNTHGTMMSGPLFENGGGYGSSRPLQQNDNNDDSSGDDDDDEDDQLVSETEDEQDFGDEAFKLVADDINVNVNALLQKLRQADTFDRRETMLKKGNVKNANIVHVEMYDDDEEEENDEDEEDEEDNDGDDNNQTEAKSTASGARKLWDRLTGTGGAASPTQTQGTLRSDRTNNDIKSPQSPTSSYRKLDDGGGDNNDNNNNTTLSPQQQQHEDLINSHVSVSGALPPRNRGGSSSNISPVSPATPTTASNNALGRGLNEDDLNAAEEERLAILHANETAQTAANSRENEDVLINEMAQQAKARLTADKHSGGTNASRLSKNSKMTKTSRKSTNRFDGRESEEMSASTFRDDDASVVSFNPDGSAKPRSALKRNKKKAGGAAKKAAVIKSGGRTGVSFSQNEVSEVCIFEVGDELYVGVQFKRSWVGWIAAFMAVIFETVFDVHVVYLYETLPYKIGAIQAWVGCNRLIVSGILFMIAYFAGVGVQPLKHVTSPYGILILSLMALALAIGVSLEAVIIDVTGSAHFFVASVAYCLWIVLYRLFIKEAVFLVEVLAIIATVAGFVISNVMTETELDTKTAVTGNVLIFIASILYAAYFFLLSRVRKWAPIVPMATFQGIYAVLIALPLAAILKQPASDIFAFVTDGTLFAHAMIIAVEGVISNILLILTIDYLDVLSVATIFVLKQAAMPIFAKLIVLDNFDIQEDKKVDTVNLKWYVYVGYILAIVGGVVTVVFASLRRSFVTRRIASSKRKKAPNPYTKKKRRMEREAAAMGITPEQHQAQLAAQQQQYQAYLQQQQYHQQLQMQQQQQQQLYYNNNNAHIDNSYGDGGGGSNNNNTVQTADIYSQQQYQQQYNINSGYYNASGGGGVPRSSSGHRPYRSGGGGRRKY